MHVSEQGIHLKNSHATNSYCARLKLAFEVIYKALLCKLLEFFENLTQWESIIGNNCYNQFSSTSEIPYPPRDVGQIMNKCYLFSKSKFSKYH